MHDILVPFEQEGTKAIVRSWLKQIGDTVAENDPLVELETDKVTQEVPAPCAGVLAEILLDPDSEALPGALLGRLRPAGAAAAAVEPTALHATDQSDAADLIQRRQRIQPVRSRAMVTVLSPAVRRALLDFDVDPVHVEGTGRDGRITRADVEAFVTRRETAAPPQSPDQPFPSAAATGASRFIPHDRMRLAIAANMLGSVTTAPHVTAVFEADFSAIIAHRRRQKDAFARDGANLTFTAYFIAACVTAMKAAPNINSRWHDDRLELFDDVNIGVGTALGDKGLVVPVIHRAQQMSLLGIAQRLTDLVTRARDGKLAPADMRGGTFTISNHGVSGSLFASPIIINQPQSAILGIGKTEKRVVVREVDGIDTIQIRPMAYVSLTIDHRALDGHQTNTWLSAFVQALETWPQ